MLNKRGQLTLFVILGLVVIIAVVIVSLFLIDLSPDRGDSGKQIGERTNAQEFIEECVGAAVEEELEVILANGGVKVVEDPKIFYKLHDVNYLCYADQPNKVCDNLEPMLISRVEMEIGMEIELDVKDCFGRLLESYSSYDINTGSTDLNINIEYEKMVIDISKELSLSSESETIYEEDFGFEVSDRTYTLLRLAQRIIEDEVDCNCGNEACNADLYGLIRQNYGFSIEKDLVNDGSEIFTITEDRNDREFVFAIKNCVNEA